MDYASMTDDQKMEAADKVASALQGTCMETIEGQLEQQGLPEELADDQVFLDVIDENVFVCGSCGWWCEAGEANENPDGSGEDLCGDCHNEGSDEDD